jgi:phage-related holin
MKTNLTGIILSASTTGAFICSYFMDLTLNNVEQYVALVSVLLVDGFFGVWAGAKREGFKTFKALKVLKSIFFWVLLLTAVLTIEKAFLGTEWLSETILIPFLIFQILSILKNASMLGLVPLKVLKQILDKIDQHKH